jgi:hypothetical protein
MAADRLDRRWDGLPDHLQPRAAVQALQLRAWSCAVTLRIARVKGDREATFNTASGALLEIGGRAMVATAWHVLEEFRRSRDKGETVVLICDNMAIEHPRTVYRDERHDIALLEVPPRGREGIQAMPYRPGILWPAPKVRVADTILVCGFPKRFRWDGEQLLHGDLNLLVDVAATGEGYFMLNINWKSLANGGRVVVPPQQVDWGGTSGGPVFLWDAGPNPLVGVVSEAGFDLPLWRIAALANMPSDLAAKPSAAI